METSLDYFYKCDDRNDRIYRAISSGTLDISIVMSYSVSSSNKYL